MSTKFDVIIIGGGPGGTPAAMQLASQGKTVLIVEESGRLGGACLFVGCIPSKIIRHWANEFAVKRKNGSSEDRMTAWNQIKTVMNHILEKRSNAAMQMLSNLPNVTFVAGQASFVSNNELVILAKDTGNQENYSFEQAIIATGVRSFIPPFDGNGVEEVLTSEIFFAQDQLPETLLIVGGGPIGIELSQMLSKLGVKCTIVELMDTILPKVVDTQFASIINNNLKQLGIDIYTSSKVLEVNKINNQFEVRFTSDSADSTSEYKQVYDQVLVATGKIPNIESLDLGSTNIEFDHKGISVDEHLETSVNGIYATGDVINGPKFAHTASYEAHLAATNIAARNIQKVDFSKNSWVLFSDPEIAVAGLTEQQAIDEGYEVITGVYDYKIDAAAQVRNAPFGYLKYVINKKNLQIIGIHICHSNASSLAGEAALIVANRLTLKEVAQAVHPHPTLTEAFGVLALKLLSQVRH